MLPGIRHRPPRGLETVVILGAIALFLIHNDLVRSTAAVWIASGRAATSRLAAIA